jgi:HD-like signal output (HDOD) protein
MPYKNFNDHSLSAHRHKKFSSKKEHAMGKVNVDDLRSGMVLASDLKDSVGRFLLQHGTVIQDKHIQILKSWGITEADIEGLDQKMAAEGIKLQIDPDILKKCEDYASMLFQYSNSDHEATRELKRLRVLHLAKILSDGGNLPEFDSVRSEERIIPIRRAAEKEKLLSPEALVKNAQLTSFPDIYYRIIKVLNDPESSASHLAEVISKDTSLSSKLLRIANSAFYGLPAKVDTVTRAITLIGLNEISTLAMGVLAMRFFKSIPQKLIDMKTFWIHSIACGSIASIIARNKKGLGEERFFVAGMLHDVGRLITAITLPQKTVQAILESRNRLIPLYKMEKEIFGYDHARVALLLLRKWNFPLALENMVGFHHEPANAPQPLDAAITHFANIVSLSCQFGHSGEIFVPPISDKAWEVMSISPSVLAPAISQTERMVNEMMKDFIDA